MTAATLPRPVAASRTRGMRRVLVPLKMHAEGRALVQSRARVEKLVEAECLRRLVAFSLDDMAMTGPTPGQRTAGQRVTGYHRVQVPLKMYPSGLEYIDDCARSEGVVRSELLRRLIAHGLEHMPQGWAP